MAQYLIVGAGIIGLTVARELIARGARDILILEKEDEPGRHASGKNSGILHAGIYYSPDSFKARFCLEGNARMQEYCRKNGLPLLATQKVIVAKNEAELPVLEELERRARANGADVDLIDLKALAKIEPHAKTTRQALLSRNTATVSPKAVLECLRAELVASGKAEVRTSAKFLGLAGKNVARAAGLSGLQSIEFEMLINAGGAHADTVARAFGLAENYRLIPFMGSYKKLRPEKRHLVNGNIYPVPDIRNPFLGAHFSKGTDGEVYIGPTATPVFGRENYERKLAINAEAAKIFGMDAVLFCVNSKFRDNAFSEIRKYSKRSFFRDVRKMLEGLEPEDVIASTKAGIRPQLVDWKKKELVMDFTILRAENSIHVLNAISPAFTSSLVMAEHIVREHL